MGCPRLDQLNYIHSIDFIRLAQPQKPHCKWPPPKQYIPMKYVSIAFQLVVWVPGKVHPAAMMDFIVWKVYS